MAFIFGVLQELEIFYVRSACCRKKHKTYGTITLKLRVAGDSFSEYDFSDLKEFITNSFVINFCVIWGEG